LERPTVWREEGTKKAVTKRPGWDVGAGSMRWVSTAIKKRSRALGLQEDHVQEGCLLGGRQG